jgi:hypothetical protein
MITKKSKPRIAQILFLICVICGPVYAQTDRWTDYAGSDVDIFPNVTYAKANNIELKLDLTCCRTFRWVGPLLTLNIERDINRRRPRRLKTHAARSAG